MQVKRVGRAVRVLHVRASRLLYVSTVAALAVAGLSACTIAVPTAADPEATVKPSAPASYAGPTVQAGHDAAAVAGKNMTFADGETLSANVPVTFSDGLGMSTGNHESSPSPPEWTLLFKDRAGQSGYSSRASCVVTYSVTARQGPLIVAGDDKGSTENLMKYLIPSVLPSSLQEANLPWVAEAGKAGPSISFLKYSTKATAQGPASTVWARLLGKAGTGLVLSLACPSDALLESTTPTVMAKLSVAPPSN